MNPAPTLLLHCCCGPCGSACIERLLQEGRSCRLLFSNSNLDCREEFDRRLENLQRVAGFFGLGEVMVDEYRHGDWLDHVGRLPDFQSLPEGGGRCALCFSWSLSRAQYYAEREKCAFATSLTVSPHKSSKLLAEVGGGFSRYEHHDFKKKDGFLRSLQLSRQLGLYRQDYCGCEFSRRSMSVRSCGSCSDQLSSKAIRR